MRLLLGPQSPGLPAAGSALSLDDLELLYGHDASGTPDSPFVRANMVAGLDGTIATEGLSAGLSGPADKEVFAVLRAWSDVVLVGAGTARIEGYGPARIRPTLTTGRVARHQSPAPSIAVVSASLVLDPTTPLMRDPSTLVITSAHAYAERGQGLAGSHGVIIAGDSAIDFGVALRRLAERGLTQILCEGGPTLLGALATEGLIDELCLSLAPRAGGGTGTALFGSASVPQTELDLYHVIESDGFLMTRYRCASARRQQ